MSALLAYGAHVDQVHAAHKVTALQLACHKEDYHTYSVVGELLDPDSSSPGADPNIRDLTSPYSSGTALHGATRNNNLGVVEMLLEYGARVDIQDATGMTPLDLAEEKEYDDIAKVLRKYARMKRRKTSSDAKNGR